VSTPEKLLPETLLPDELPEAAAGSVPARVAAPVPSVTALRTRRQVIELGTADEPRWTVRVQMPEVWDTIRVLTPPSEPVISMKVRALEALYPAAEFHENYVLKLHGWEVLDENASLESVGAANGSIFLLTYRFRRPVR
jgi:hypothetical protein